MVDDNVIENKIKENATNPKSVEVDGQKVEQHALKDVIEADKYLASKAAVRKNGSGIKFSKMEASGA